MRCFIAIDIPENIKEEIFKKFGGLVDKNLFSGRVVEKDNLHLTLKFLGELGEEKVKEVKERLKKIKFEKFNARLGKVGFFDNEKYIRIIWVELTSNKLFDLQKQISDEFSEIDFGFKGFHSHITIIRVKSVKDKPFLVEKLKKIGFGEMRFDVKEFVLMNSKQVNGKRVYETIKKYN